ncbi:MAG: LPS-assembly protein LptD [Gammaproteobacteria bacterium]|nr:LPS-assembly protein LptD [Gammaproteobacteria bacterium]
MKLKYLLSVILPLSLYSLNLSAVQAASQRCQPSLIIPAHSPAPAASKTEQTTPPSKQTIESDSLNQPSKATYLFEGNAILKQPGLVVSSDQITFDKTQQTAQFSGDVELRQDKLLIQADHAQLNQALQTTQLEKTRYQILPSRIHGRAKVVDIDDTSHQTILTDASLTACKETPAHAPDWKLSFETLKIDNAAQRAIGHNTVLRFKRVPIFYTPYFDYPLNDRATGLLFPKTGSYKSITQTKSLQYIALPYFFNIASNIDDTLTLIPMTQRGLALDNEFRYLGQNGRINHRTSLKTTVLQDTLEADQTRWRASINAQQNWGGGFSSDIIWHEVSDENFFADIPVETHLQTVTQTARRLAVNYRQEGLHAYARLMDTLRLRNAPLNYEKWPELGINYTHQSENLGYSLHADATEFILPDVTHTKPEALRVHLSPQVSYNTRNSYSHVTAQMIANQTQYQMHDNGYNTTGSNSHTRFIPQFAVRAGLIFERNFAFSGQDYTQTLEPEIQYLYTPYEDQSNLPLFDTANRSLAFSNLFALNRFTGSDRIGDANQVSTALTTKLLDAKGRQLAQAGIGQIHYLDDRRVALTGTSLQTDTASDIFITAGINYSSLYFSTTVQMAQKTGLLTNANSRLKYETKQHSNVMLTHTLQNNGTLSEIETLSLGAYTQIHNDWQVGAYSNYDIRNQQVRETRFGLRYDSCCWATEIVAEQTQLENGLYNDSIKIQFELKGISTPDNAFKKDLNRRFNF